MGNQGWTDASSSGTDAAPKAIRNSIKGGRARASPSFVCCCFEQEGLVPMRYGRA